MDRRNFVKQNLKISALAGIGGRNQSHRFQA